MARIVKGGLIQATNDVGAQESIKKIKDAAIEKHLNLIDEAASQGVQLLCMQEIFFGPYFCAEQNTRWYHATERIPDGPTVQLMQEKARQHSMVIVVPIYEE